MLCGMRTSGLPAARAAWRTAAAIFVAAALSGASRAAEPAPGGSRRPSTYGTADRTYVSIDATAFSTTSSGFHWACLGSCQLRYVTDNTGEVLTAPVHLPGGAVVDYMEVDYYDGSASGEVTASLESCSAQGDCTRAAGACPLDTVCSGIPEAPGYSSSNADLSASPVPIDNSLYRYVIVASNTTIDGSTAISQVILGYKLRVSPPPASATFGDVPTSHPFFQYVEALAASGITGGCGGGNYCPNAALTRGQMAVFLAKALGLQWP